MRSLLLFPLVNPARQSLRWLVLILMALPLLVQAQCPFGDFGYVNLTTQAQVNTFPPGCVNFRGTLTISGADITDLSPLANLKTITDQFPYGTSSLVISGNTSLSSLDGLNKLQSVVGDLRLESNPQLTSVTGLTSLNSVGNNLQINNDVLLTSLDGLNKLQSVGGALQIQNNSRLTSIAALTALTSVSTDLLINSNALLTSLDGLNRLQSVGARIEIQSNPQLAVCALQSICQFLVDKSANNIRISGNASGCGSLQQVQDNCTPLAITSQPPSASAVCPGAIVTATVSATGTARAYQWYKDNQAVSGQTTNTLSLTNVQAAEAGAYRVVVSNSVSSLTSTAFNLTVNPLPVVSITGLASAYCKNASAVGLTGSPQGGHFTVNGTQANQIVPANLAPGSYTVAYSYTNSNGCSATTSQTVTINALPIVSIVPSALTGCAGTLITLSAQGADRYEWNTGATTTSIPVSATGTGVYSVTGTTISTGCSATASQAITIYPLPATPTLLTQQGQSYPGGQSSVNVDVNSGNVNLVVGGCNGTLNWSGPNNTSRNTSPITVSTERVGTFIYTATCTSMQGCTSGPASATVTVGGRLTVLHRDVDNYADNNSIQPVLVLQNQGTSALPLSRLTLRYYLTLEGNSALSNLSVNYAQVGNQNVRLRYVPLQTAQQGATGYVEVSFTAGAGSLAAGANSGVIQTYFARGDYGTLLEPNDYSYNPVRDQLTATQRITAYYDGVLIAGIEPGANTQIRALRALTESRNGPSATQINTVLEVRNEGTVAINYSDLRARYYFTSDGNERLQVELDEGQVSTQLVALSQPVAGANYYLEIRYNQGGQLALGASTGAIRYRISKPQGGRLDQTNDYSYQERPQERSQNSRVVVYVGQEVVWGTPPTGTGARVAVGQEPGTELQVTVLGNPVRSDKVSVQIKGAGGEPLQLQLVSAQGRVLIQQQIAAPKAVEQHDLSLSGQGLGVYLLQVSTPTQSRTVRVLKSE